MNRTLNLNTILTQIERLSYDTRLVLMQKMISLLKNPPKYRSKIRLSELSGVGSEIWKKIDIDHYVQNERQWS